MGSIDKKTGGKKSCDTVPLILLYEITLKWTFCSYFYHKKIEGFIPMSGQYLECSEIAGLNCL
jgi:hypothetical protein